MALSLGFDRDSLREGLGSGVRFQQPPLTMRDSTGSSIVSNRTNGGDRHDVVSLL
jgi:hypothetical protein